ncbi:hypothetical protein KEM56_000032 [Ascosphaera pollenicola]|nr:hypothetical protein KEM56_000032 [Ascosphaera pollenicola]
MPPFLPRKRGASPVPRRSKRLASSITAVGPEPEPAGRVVKKEIKEDLSDDTSSLSSLASVAKSPLVAPRLEGQKSSEHDRQSKTAGDDEISDNDDDGSLKEAAAEKGDGGEEEDDDDEEEEEEWEDVMTPTDHTPTQLPSFDNIKDIEVTLDKSQTVADVTSKKGPTKNEREARIGTHCLHVKCLLYHNAIRNAWLNDKEDLADAQRLVPTMSSDMEQDGKLRQKSQEEDEEEEDYMSMVIEEPKKPRGKETVTQMRLRKQRESELKGRVPSKAERAAAEAAQRQEALSKNTLDPSNKGFKMMQKLGYKHGTALGRHSTEPEESQDAKRRRLLEPIAVSLKEDRGGIGLDTEKKRKIREQFKTVAKQEKAEESNFRERVRREREEKRLESQFAAAQKVIEKFDADEAEDDGSSIIPETSIPDKKTLKRATKRLSEVNILYRGLIKSRLESLKVNQAYREMLSRRSPSLEADLCGLPAADNSELDRDDRLALGQDIEALRHVTHEEEEDQELEEFESLPPAERLSKAVSYLRKKYNYCFWCKYQYASAEMEGCPGLTEEDHD